MASIKSSKQQKLRSRLLQGYDWGEKKIIPGGLFALPCPDLQSSTRQAH